MLFQEEERSKIKTLSKKIDELLNKFQEIKSENENLKHEIIALKASNEAKDQHIKSLEEKLSMSEFEGDEILSRIEEVLSR